MGRRVISLYSGQHGSHSMEELFPFTVDNMVPILWKSYFPLHWTTWFPFYGGVIANKKNTCFNRMGTMLSNVKGNNSSIE
jgi:hypothetical protein